MTYAEFERRAEQAMAPRSGRTSPAVPATSARSAPTSKRSRWALWPRMLAGATQRDVRSSCSARRCRQLAVALPVGVIGLCDRLAVGAARTRMADTATCSPHTGGGHDRGADGGVDVDAGSAGGRRGRAGETPGWFQLYPPNDRELTESFVRRRGRRLSGDRRHARHAHARLAATRPGDRQLPAAQGVVPGQLLQRSGVPRQLAAPPEEDVQAATGLWAMIFGNPALDWGDLA